MTLKKGKFADFGLEYEAYFLDNNKYYSDAQFVNGNRWNFSMLDLKTLVPGDRVIFLTHPIHWNKSVSPVLRVSCNTLHVPEFENSTGTFQVISNVQWNIQSDQPWLTVQTPTGKDNAVITVLAGSNQSSNSRTAILTLSASGVKSQTIEVTQNGTATGEDDLAAKLVRVYPNPNNGHFFLTSDTIKLKGARVTITAMSGKVIWQKVLEADWNNAIDLSQQPAGMYVLNLYTGGKSYVRKLILQ